MPEHKFKIGQRLFLVNALNAPSGPYIVVKRLPKRRGQFEYQIKSVIEPSYEYFARESQLEDDSLAKCPCYLVMKIAGFGVRPAGRLPLS